jgi:hypothetical protein
VIQVFDCNTIHLSCKCSAQRLETAVMQSYYRLSFEHDGKECDMCLSEYNRQLCRRRKLVMKRTIQTNWTLLGLSFPLCPASATLGKAPLD